MRGNDMSVTKTEDNWPLPAAEPEEVGISSQRLARIGPAMRRYIDERKVPNVITLVARHGRVVHFEAQGYMDLESQKPVHPDARFRLYSNTKPITGVATMILYEEGLLDISDPISRFIPAFKNPRVRTLEPPATPDPERAFMMPTVPARREITLRDCLRNASGIASPMRAPLQLLNENREAVIGAGWLPSADAERPATIRERLDHLARLPLNFHPGTEWEYHVGYPAAGVVLETASGMSLEQLFRERIFEPLGMKDSSFYLRDGELDRFPTCYRPGREGGEWKLQVVDLPESSPKAKGPKTIFDAGGGFGGVLSTISDYSRLAQMLLNGGELDGVRILGRKSVELMTSSHTNDLPIPMLGVGWGFGLGVGVRTAMIGRPSMRSVGAYGWGGAAGTTYFADPKEGLFAACFTQVLAHNAMPGNMYQEDFERLVYQALV
jgi:CubicO group peptidase (beta-lactamase class C family)